MTDTTNKPKNVTVGKSTGNIRLNDRCIIETFKGARSRHDTVIEGIAVATERLTANPSLQGFTVFSEEGDGFVHVVALEFNKCRNPWCELDQDTHLDGCQGCGKKTPAEERTFICNNCGDEFPHTGSYRRNDGTGKWICVDCSQSRNL